MNEKLRDMYVRTAQAVQADAPQLAELQADATLRTMLSLLLPQMRLDVQAIKVQVNEGEPAWPHRP